MALTAVLLMGLAAGVTAVCTPAAMWLARRTGVLDHPGPLKPQSEAVPYLGGLSVFLGMAAATAWSAHPVVLVPITLALLLGLADDVLSLPALGRLVAQLGIGAGVAVATQQNDLPSAVLVAVVSAALMNAVNLVDGIDGLAAGVCLVSGVGFAFVTESGWSPVAAAAGACAGFLLFNRPPAKIYLGDAGTYLLGTWLAVLAAGQWEQARTPSVLVVVAALLGYPLVELVSSIGRRLLTGRPLLMGDRAHAYDRMVHSGLPVARVTSILVLGQAGVAAVGVLAYELNHNPWLRLFAALLLVLTSAVACWRGVRSSSVSSGR